MFSLFWVKMAKNSKGGRVGKRVKMGTEFRTLLRMCCLLLVMANGCAFLVIFSSNSIRAGHGTFYFVARFSMHKDTRVQRGYVSYSTIFIRLDCVFFFLIVQGMC